MVTLIFASEEKFSNVRLSSAKSPSQLGWYPA